MASCQVCEKNLVGQQRKYCSPDCRYKGTTKNANAAYAQWRVGKPLDCEFCGTALTGRQMRWCSIACKRDHETQVAMVEGIATLTRKCTKCGLVKPLEQDFYLTPTGTYRRHCRACVMAGNRDRDAQPDQRDKKRDQHLRSLYAITAIQYERLLVEQGGVCAVCGKPPMKMRLAVDHDHRTLRVRGLLCNYCNLRVIGKFTNPEILRKASEYLENPPARKVLDEDHVVPSRRPPKKRRSRRKKAAAC